MKKYYKNAFGSTYLQVELDPLNRCVYVAWLGYSTAYYLKKGVAVYTKALTNVAYNSILIDTRHLIGTWEHSLEWMLHNWAPAAAGAGLEYYALVVQPETFAEETAEEFYEKISEFKVKVFEDVEEARRWIRAQNNPAFSQLDEHGLAT